MNFDPNDYNELTVTESPIPGLFVIKLPVHGDNRGWFKENYQKEKMETLGLPSFDIVQNNISFNDKAGATRGLHAEPWNKFISTANGGRWRCQAFRSAAEASRKLAALWPVRVSVLISDFIIVLLG